MKIWQRFASAAETITVVGPASLAGMLVMACLSSLLLVFRLLSQGYHRFLFSSK